MFWLYCAVDCLASPQSLWFSGIVHCESFVQTVCVGVLLVKKETSSKVLWKNQIQTSLCPGKEVYSLCLSLSPHHHTHTLLDKVYIYFFTAYSLPGEFSHLTWSACSLTTIAYITTLILFYLPACEIWTGVGCLVSLERATQRNPNKVVFLCCYLNHTLTFSDQNNIANRAKRALFNKSVSDSLLCSTASPVLTASSNPLCVYNNKSASTGLTALSYLSYSHSAFGSQKEQVVTEIPSWSVAVVASPLLVAVLLKDMSMLQAGVWCIQKWCGA